MTCEGLTKGGGDVGLLKPRIRDRLDFELALVYELSHSARSSLNTVYDHSLWPRVNSAESFRPPDTWSATALHLPRFRRLFNGPIPQIIKDLIDQDHTNSTPANTARSREQIPSLAYCDRKITQWTNSEHLPQRRTLPPFLWKIDVSTRYACDLISSCSSLTFSPPFSTELEGSSISIPGAHTEVR
jgi:hypothetical protein